ncbi:hypothetical protein [Wolbachia endosymbiont (group E) of Neria commutata]|uniref:hypothetical protein n=1 Tax=Wolbachia endosymbiont (group E) of Neria commutata TaxID=3066149 RepID=UPI0031331746
MVGDNFQQKKEKILAWFKENELNAENPKCRGLKDPKSIMLQAILMERNLNTGSNVKNSLLQKNNKALEEPLSQLSENTLEQVKEKTDNLATFKKPSIKF